MLVAICGLKRSGKDTIAKHIDKQYGYKHIKIAEPIKQICKILFNFSDEQMETDIKEEIDPRWQVSPRTVMQFLGTEIFQNQINTIIPNLNRQLFMKSIVFKEDTNYVISDMRFLHEYSFIKEKYPHSIVIRVEKSNDYHDSHISETEWQKIPFDYIVYNNSTIEDLHIQIDKILKSKKKQEDMSIDFIAY